MNYLIALIGDTLAGKTRFFWTMKGLEYRGLVHLLMTQKPEIYNTDHYILIDTPGVERYLFGVSDWLCKCNLFILMYSNKIDKTEVTESIKKWINTVKTEKEKKEYLNPKVITHFFILGNNKIKDHSYNIKKEIEEIKRCFENVNFSIHDVGLVNLNGKSLDENKIGVTTKFNKINKIIKEKLDEATIKENEKIFSEISKKKGKNFDGITKAGKDSKKDKKCENCRCYFY